MSTDARLPNSGQVITGLYNGTDAKKVLKCPRLMKVSFTLDLK